MIEEQIREAIRVGDVFQNPGGGTSAVTRVEADFVQYRRGTSDIRLKFEHMEQAYEKFRGKTVTTVDLQELQPEVFNSRRNGHSCNCTFLFMLFEKAGLTSGGIKGKGVRGNPYKIRLKASDDRSQNNRGILRFLKKSE